MVRGKSLPAKNQSSKKHSSVTGKLATGCSPAASSSKAKTYKHSSLTSCVACGIVITDDVKALQCDRCQSSDMWKCADCLNLPADMYNHLVSDSNCSLRWFCPTCDKMAMESDSHSSNKIDNLVGLVEKLLDKLGAVETQMSAKCDIETIVRLDARVKSLEDRSQQQEHEFTNKLISSEQKILGQLDAKMPDSALSGQQVGTKDLQQSVVEQVKKKIDEDNDAEKRKNNVILYKVGEMDADSAADRNESDLAYVTELLDSVFKINPERNGVVKVFRLGPWDSAKEVPRPLLVMFNDPESKERVMSSLRCLRDADVPFKGISIAHDMTPWQRDEIRRLVQQAKQEHVSSSSEPAENFWFRVVGKGVSMRVRKVRKQQQSTHTQGAE